MPTYTYHCPKCGYFDQYQGIKEAALTQCPACQRPVHRVIGKVNVMLKSEGFYATDHNKSDSCTTE